MDMKELALEEASLKALADAVKDRLAEVRSQTQELLEKAEAESGARQVAAMLPDGTTVAVLSLPDVKPAARVIDEDAYRAWVQQTFPTEISRRFVTEVQAAFTNRLLGEMTAAGVARVVDRETGEMHDVPGVEVKPTRSRSHSLRLKPDGASRIAAAWQAGTLPIPGVTRPELPGEHSQAVAEVRACAERAGVEDVERWAWELLGAPMEEVSARAVRDLLREMNQSESE